MPLYAKAHHEVWHIVSDDRDRELAYVPVLCGVRSFIPTAWAVPFTQDGVCFACKANLPSHEGIEPGDFVQIVAHVDLPVHLRRMLGRIGQVTHVYAVNYPPRFTISRDPRQIAIVDLKRVGSTKQTIVRKIPLVALDRLTD